MTNWTITTQQDQTLQNAGLTDRQREIFLLKTAGVGTRTIARAYNLSPAEVRSHLSAAERKIERARGATS